MKVHRVVWLVKGILPLLLITSLVFVSSCKKKETPDPEPTGEVTNEEINKWVLDSMNYYYYWNASIPSARNLNFNARPETFFESLLRRPDDRFSWIQNRKELEDQLAGVIRTSGLGVSFFRFGENGAGATVRFVHKGSPADLAGIKRGDIFIRVNGQALTVSGSGSVQHANPLFGNETFTVTKGVISGSTISPGEDVSLTPVENFQEKAIHLDTVLTTQSGVKVAYLFYNRFLQQQAQELVEAFNRFKTAGVTELIVDERYNGGGSIGVAALLSALIHRNFNINTPFILYEFNNNFTNATLTYADLFGANNANVVNTNNLGLDRVFVLATQSSASASELLINNLKPFLGNANVVHIGSTTYGKDDASITISNSSPRFEGENDWGIQPIILKYKNRDGGGGFVNGLTPMYTVSETVPFAPMGSSEDPLIGRALSIIDPSMQAVFNKQMNINRRNEMRFNPNQLAELNKELSNPRPADATETLKGRGLELR